MNKHIKGIFWKRQMIASALPRKRRIPYIEKTINFTMKILQFPSFSIFQFSNLSIPPYKPSNLSTSKTLKPPLLLHGFPNPELPTEVELIRPAFFPQLQRLVDKSLLGTVGVVESAVVGKQGLFPLSIDTKGKVHPL